MSDYDDDAIRQDEGVQRAEQAIRNAAGDTDPLEFAFTKTGMRLFAKLGAARVRAAIIQRKARNA